MVERHATTPQLFDLEPRIEHLREEVLAGLLRPRKELPSKFLYDDCGSQLFDQICDLEEYYPTRTEIAIMQEWVGDMAAVVGPHCCLIEYGSGSSTKSHILLQALHEPSTYMPIDISRVQLLAAAQESARTYPDLEVLPICADYTADFTLPTPRNPSARRVVYFPGSTIGNFHFWEAQRFLQRVAEICGPHGGLLIGVDLKKDPERLHAAYNDARGVTAAFNLNMLARINRELGASFQLEQYRHYAFYNPHEGRIEMHLASLAEQRVQIDGCDIDFALGETIWTESSYKYTLTEFARLAGTAGFDVRRVWTDREHLFSVQYLEARG